METEAKWVESVATSLVREFLSRKGLKLTLHYLDRELPQGEKSINNRSRLICELHLEQLIKKNKASVCPLRTLLEIITKELQQSKIPNNGNLYMVNADKRTNASKISQSNVKGPVIYHYREEKRPNREDSNRAALLEGIKSASVEDLFHSEIRSTVPRGVPKIISFSKDSLVSEVKDDANINASIEKLHLSAGEFKKTSRPPSEGKGVKSNTRVSPLLKVKQFSNIHSNLEYQNRQRRKPLSGESLKKTEPVVCINSLENRLGLLNKHNSSVLPLASKKVGITIEKLQTKSEDFSKSLKVTSLKTTSVLPSKTKKNMDDLELCDFSDSEINFEPITAQTTKENSSSRPITVTEACELKKLLFGSPNKSFGSEWRRQAFTFNSCEAVRYGIVQKKGGPCGILAAVQAHVICELLFSGCNNNCTDGCLRPSLESCCQALAKSLSLILWRAGLRQKALVAIPSGRQVLDVHSAVKEKLQCDGLTEQLVLSVFSCFNSLSCFLLEKISEFQNEGKDGCILFLYSVILSRGIESVKEDMDDPTTYIIGRHGYCTQEMVNLLLVGYAASNVFDGNLELNTGGTEKTVLRGIQSSSDIGLLSLFEHYDSCKVGSNYKNPNFPIWVVLSESHFSVLFSISRDINTTTAFNLFYYDGLTHQTEEICLTIDMSVHHQRTDGDDLIPPLELCICTKWSGAKISWNGTEPLL